MLLRSGNTFVLNDQKNVLYQHNKNWKTGKQAVNPPVVDTGSNSSGGLASFFGAESCSSRLLSFSLSFSKFPGFRSLMSRERFLHRTSISNLRFSCGKGSQVRASVRPRAVSGQSGRRGDEAPWDHVPDAAPREHSWWPWSKGSGAWRPTLTHTHKDKWLQQINQNESFFSCSITNICLLRFFLSLRDGITWASSVTHHASETGLQDFGHKGNHIQ